MSGPRLNKIEYSEHAYQEITIQTNKIMKIITCTYKHIKRINLRLSSKYSSFMKWYQFGMEINMVDLDKDTVPI